MVYCITTLFNVIQCQSFRLSKHDMLYDSYAENIQKKIFQICNRKFKYPTQLSQVHLVGVRLCVCSIHALNHHLTAIFKINHLSSTTS